MTARRRPGSGSVVRLGEWESVAFTWWEDAWTHAQRTATRTGVRQRVHRRNGFWQVCAR